MITDDNKKKLKMYFVFGPWIISDVRIFTVVKIKKGLSISIGCNLKKDKSNHLFAPLTSTPIKGTNTKEINEIRNNGIIIFFNNGVSMKEIENIIIKDKRVKIKCFVKKK